MILTIEQNSGDQTGAKPSGIGIAYEHFAAAVSDKGWSSLLSVTNPAGKDGPELTVDARSRLSTRAA